jgi:L-rhamnose mutarotase
MKAHFLICCFFIFIVGCNYDLKKQGVNNNEDEMHAGLATEISEEAKEGYVIPADSTQVKRYCMTLDLKENPELIEEYKYWHQDEHIWPEIPVGMREVGIRDMEIYLYGNRMFLIMETTMDFDLGKDFERMGQLPGQKEWADFVLKFQQSVPGAPNGSTWQLMERVYNLK